MNTTRFKNSVSNALTELGLGKPDGLLSPLELAMFAAYIEDHRNFVPISIGTISIEERYEGYIVFKVSQDNEAQYFRMDGTYDPQTEDVDWHDATLREVQKKEKVVYLYE